MIYQINLPIMKYFLLIFSFLIYTSISCQAQTADTSKIVTIETTKKLFLEGELIKITDDSIFLYSDNLGHQAFSKKEVLSISDGVLSTGFSSSTNSSTPYWVETALTNGKGNNYYRNYYIFANEFKYGISNHFDFSFAFETASLIFDSQIRLPGIQLGLKYGTTIDKYFHVGVSTKYLFNSEGSVVFLSTPITLGGKRTNITFAPSITLKGEPSLFSGFANFSLGLSQRSRFVVDFVYIDNQELATLLYEFQFSGGTTISLGVLLDQELAIPNLAFSVPFGRWKRKRK